MIRAAKFTARGEYAVASMSLKRIFRLYRKSLPTGQTPLLANILYAQLCDRAGSKEKAYYACEVALKQLANERLEYSVSNINYLKFRCKWILSRISEYRDSQAMRLACSINVSPSDAIKGDVSPTIRRFFPMTISEAEDVDTYLSLNC